jgi:hypothetical protein
MAPRAIRKVNKVGPGARCGPDARQLAGRSLSFELRL